jgi:hypothetical protein
LGLREKILPLLGFEVLTAVIMNKLVFWDMSYSPLKVKRRFGETYHIHFQSPRISEAKKERENSTLPPAFMLVSCADFSSTPKMDATCSSETSVDFKQIRRRYIP